MNRFKATHPVELPGSLLGALVTTRGSDHLTTADHIGAALAGMSSPSLTQETI